MALVGARCRSIHSRYHALPHVTPFPKTKLVMIKLAGATAAAAVDINFCGVGGTRGRTISHGDSFRRVSQTVDEREKSLPSLTLTRLCLCLYPMME